GTAKAATPNRWRHDEHGHEDGHAVACAARCRQPRSDPRVRAREQPLAENLVRDARVCQGWQGRLLLPKRAEVQHEYATFGFSDTANIDEGALWPVAL